MVLPPRFLPDVPNGCAWFGAIIIITVMTKARSIESRDVVCQSKYADAFIHFHAIHTENAFYGKNDLKVTIKMEKQMNQ